MPSVMLFFYREKAGLHSRIRKQATQLNEANEAKLTFQGNQDTDLLRSLDSSYYMERH